MTLLSLLLACAPVEIPVNEPQVSCAPEPGEVYWVEGQRSFSNLEDALDQSGAWHTLCLGEGGHLLDEDLQELEVSGRVHLLGRGQELTWLEIDPDLGAETFVLNGIPQQLVLEDLALNNPMELVAQNLLLRQVAMVGVESSGSLLRLHAPTLRTESLRIQDCRFSYGGVIVGETPQATPAVHRDLHWEGNVAALGMHLLAEGERPLQLIDPVLVGSADSGARLGYQMVYSYGGLLIEGGRVEALRSTGPLFSSRDLELRGVEITDSRGMGGGLLQSSERLALRDVSIQDSRVTDALLYLFQGGVWPTEMQLERVDLGTDLPNETPCSLALGGVCAADDWGYIEDWSCKDCMDGVGLDL